MSEYSLALPFDTDDPEFVRGFEIGVMWDELNRDGGAREFTIHGTNAEMALRMAEAVDMSMTWEELSDDWVGVSYV